MKDFRRGTILILGLLAILLAARPSPAEDSELARREELLRSKLTLVFLFERDMPELARRGEGVSQLENEIRGVLQENPAAGGLLDLLHELQIRWAKLELSRDNVDEALAHLDVVLKAGPGAGSYREAAVITAGIFRDQGETFEKAGQDDAALERYARAEELFRAGGDTESATAVGRLSARLESKEGLEAYGRKDYDTAFEKLSGLQQRGLPGFAGSEGDQALDWMKENTGVLEIRTLAVPPEVPGQTVDGLNIALKRVRGGDDVTRKFARKFRWQTGEYRLELLGGDRQAVLTVPVNLTTTGGTGEIPSKLPDGMAFIPKGGGVSKGFFIDRAEVTVGEFRKQFPSRNFKFSQSSLPAHGVTFAEAQSFAAKVGKKLPSYEQWQRAAFGDSNHKYPWGSDDTITRHCKVGLPEPRPAGSIPNSPSRDYGLLDMAGSVWEWLDDEYAIGGGFKDRFLILPFKSAGWDNHINFLKDKRPSKRLYQGFRDAKQAEKYETYHVRDDILEEVGIRCVLEF